MTLGTRGTNDCRWRKATRAQWWTIVLAWLVGEIAGQDEAAYGNRLDQLSSYKTSITTPHPSSSFLTHPSFSTSGASSATAASPNVQDLKHRVNQHSGFSEASLAFPKNATESEAFVSQFTTLAKPEVSSEAPVFHSDQKSSKGPSESGISTAILNGKSLPPNELLQSLILGLPLGMAEYEVPKPELKTKYGAWDTPSRSSEPLQTSSSSASKAVPSASLPSLVTSLTTTPATPYVSVYHNAVDVYPLMDHLLDTSVAANSSGANTKPGPKGSPDSPFAGTTFSAPLGRDKNSSYLGMQGVLEKTSLRGGGLSTLPSAVPTSPYPTTEKENSASFPPPGEAQGLPSSLFTQGDGYLYRNETEVLASPKFSIGSSAPTRTDEPAEISSSSYFSTVDDVVLPGRFHPIETTRIADGETNKKKRSPKAIQKNKIPPDEELQSQSNVSKDASKDPISTEPADGVVKGLLTGSGSSRVEKCHSASKKNSGDPGKIKGCLPKYNKTRDGEITNIKPPEVLNPFLPISKPKPAYDSTLVSGGSDSEPAEIDTIDAVLKKNAYNSIRNANVTGTRDPDVPTESEKHHNNDSSRKSQRRRRRRRRRGYDWDDESWSDASSSEATFSRQSSDSNRIIEAEQPNTQKKATKSDKIEPKRSSPILTRNETYYILDLQSSTHPELSITSPQFQWILQAPSTVQTINSWPIGYTQPGPGGVLWAPAQWSSAVPVGVAPSSPVAFPQWVGIVPVPTLQSTASFGNVTVSTNNDKRVLRSLRYKQSNTPFKKKLGNTAIAAETSFRDDHSRPVEAQLHSYRMLAIGKGRSSDSTKRVLRKRRSEAQKPNNHYQRQKVASRFVDLRHEVPATSLVEPGTSFSSFITQTAMNSHSPHADVGVIRKPSQNSNTVMGGESSAFLPVLKIPEMPHRSAIELEASDSNAGLEAEEATGIIPAFLAQTQEVTVRSDENDGVVFENGRPNEDERRAFAAPISTFGNLETSGSVSDTSPRTVSATVASRDYTRPIVSQFLGVGANPLPSPDIYAYCYPFTESQIVEKCGTAVDLNATGVYIPMMMESQEENDPSWYTQIKRLKNETPLEVIGVAYEKPAWELIATILKKNRNLFAGVLLEWIGESACVSKIPPPTVKQLETIRDTTTRGIIRYFVRQQNFAECQTSAVPEFVGSGNFVPLKDVSVITEEFIAQNQPKGLNFPDYIQPLFGCVDAQEGLCYRAFNQNPSKACSKTAQRFAFNPYEYAGGRMMHLFNETCRGLPPLDLYGAL